MINGLVGRAERSADGSFDRDAEIVNLDPVEYLWTWFMSLCGARPQGLSGIGYSEIEAFFRLNRLAPDAWEVEALRRMDDAMLGALAKKSAPEGSGAASGRAITLDRFTVKAKRRRS